MTTRARLVARVRRAVRAWVARAPERADQPWYAYCPVVAGFTLEVLRAVGLPAMFQAGTAFWPRLRPEQDDGQPKTHTQYGYEFLWAEAQRLVYLGRMPELHCWCAVRPHQGSPAMIVDVTTGFWPEHCHIVSGMDWPGDRPPDYLWAPAHTLAARGVTYRPDLRACEAGAAFLHSALTDAPLVFKFTAQDNQA